MKLEFSQQIFEQFSSIKFNENPSNGSGAILFVRTDMTKLIFAFRNFSNTPENCIFQHIMSIILWFSQ